MFMLKSWLILIFGNVSLRRASASANFALAAGIWS